MESEAKGWDAVSSPELSRGQAAEERVESDMKDVGV